MQGSRWTRRDPCILGQRELWIQSQYEIVVHVEENDGTVLKLRADDPLRWQTQAVAVKGERLLQIADTQRDDFDSWLQTDSILISLLFGSYAPASGLCVFLWPVSQVFLAAW